jgi:hypothetical protein
MEDEEDINAIVDKLNAHRCSAATCSPVTVKVALTAFGKPGDVRDVTIGAHEWNAAKDSDEPRPFTDKQLELVFHYGQNEFQPQQKPSVSVGDIIYDADERFRYIVLPFGFMDIKTILS